MSNLILVEHEEQVKDVLQHRWTDNPVYVAVGPGAMFELEQRQVPFTIPEDYYRPRDLSIIGKESRSRVQKICSTIDGLLGESVSEVKSLGITPTLFCFHPLTMVMDVLAVRILQIKRLISEIHPQLVTAHSSPDYPLATYNIGFDNRESLYGRLLSLSGWEVDVNLLAEVAMPEDGARQRDAVIDKYVKKPIMKSSLLYDAAMKWRYLGWNSLKQLGSHFSKKTAFAVCVYGGGYNWFNLARHLARGGIRIDFLPVELNCPKKQIIGEEKQGYLVKELEENLPFRNLFVREGIDIYPLMKQRIAFLVRDNVDQVINTHEAASQFFEKRGISALLTSVKGRAIDYAICVAARHNNTPVFNWQHGAVGYYQHHTLEFFDLLTTDIYLAYGEGVCQFLDKKAKKYQAAVKPVGSISLDMLRSERKKNSSEQNLPHQLSPMKRAGKKICLYATSNYFQNNCYASYEPPPSDNLFYQTQLTLIKELLARPELCLILKLYPSPAYRKPPWLSYFQKDNSLSVVSNEYTFTDLLDYSDLIVIDWPSTTLLQAIATTKPVFVVMKHLSLFPEARQMLERRAICTDEPLGLLESLKKYLTTGIYPADISDNTFLKTYGTHLDDGRSSERAVEEVLKAIKRKGA